MKFYDFSYRKCYNKFYVLNFWYFQCFDGQVNRSFIQNLHVKKSAIVPNLFLPCARCRFSTIIQGPCNTFSTGGAKGERVSVRQLGESGHAPPEKFDFNSSNDGKCS